MLHDSDLFFGVHGIEAREEHKTNKVPHTFQRTAVFRAVDR